LLKGVVRWVEVPGGLLSKISVHSKTESS
jgi:hypothetical protein